MPLYEYECNTCSHRFEVIQKFSDGPVTECPKCQSAVRKLFSSPAIQFKGSGFYITDYARKNSPAAGSTKGEGSGEKSAGDKASGDKASGEKPSGSGSTTEAAKSDSSSTSSSNSNTANSNSGSTKTPTPSSS